MSTVYYIAWDSTALVAATAKTIIELPTPANVSVVIHEIVIGFDMTVAGSCNVQMGTYTTTGTGTAATPQKMRGDRTIDSAVVSAKIKDTVEPTTFTQGTVGGLLWPGALVPLPGMFLWQWPMAREFPIPESTLFAIRLTSVGAGNCSGWVAWTE